MDSDAFKEGREGAVRRWDLANVGQSANVFEQALELNRKVDVIFDTLLCVLDNQLTLARQLEQIRGDK